MDRKKKTKKKRSISRRKFPLEGFPQGGMVNYKIITSINITPITRNFVESLPYNPAFKRLTKGKKKEGILPEVLFCKQVHKRFFYKIDFDRQRIICNYIVYFYIKTLGLVIEIDGCSHDDKVEYDEKRQTYLENLGLKIYRIKDFDVKKNLGNVMSLLEAFIVKE